jgi:hypothetical protein
LRRSSEARSVDLEVSSDSHPLCPFGYWSSDEKFVSLSNRFRIFSAR